MCRPSHNKIDNGRIMTCGGHTELFSVLKVDVHMASSKATPYQAGTVQRLFLYGSIPSCTRWMVPASVGSWVAPRGERPFQPCVTCPRCSGWPSQHSVSECQCRNAPVEQLELGKQEEENRTRDLDTRCCLF